MRLTALKRLRYPRGPDGKEYNAGDEFETLSDRDAKALTLVRAAQEATSSRRNTKTRVMKVEPQAKPAEQTALATPAAENQEPRRYMRRDLISED